MSSRQKSTSLHGQSTKHNFWDTEPTMQHPRIQHCCTAGTGKHAGGHDEPGSSRSLSGSFVHKPNLFGFHKKVNINGRVKPDQVVDATLPQQYSAVENDARVRDYTADDLKFRSEYHPVGGNGPGGGIAQRKKHGPVRRLDIEPAPAGVKVELSGHNSTSRTNQDIPPKLPPKRQATIKQDLEQHRKNGPTKGFNTSDYSSSDNGLNSSLGASITSSKPSATLLPGLAGTVTTHVNSARSAADTALHPDSPNTRNSSTSNYVSTIGSKEEINGVDFEDIGQRRATLEYSCREVAVDAGVSVNDRGFGSVSSHGRAVSDLSGSLHSGRGTSCSGTTTHHKSLANTRIQLEKVKRSLASFNNSSIYRQHSNRSQTNYYKNKVANTSNNFDREPPDQKSAHVPISSTSSIQFSASSGLLESEASSTGLDRRTTRQKLSILERATDPPLTTLEPEPRLLGCSRRPLSAAKSSGAALACESLRTERYRRRTSSDQDRKQRFYSQELSEICVDDSPAVDVERQRKLYDTLVDRPLAVLNSHPEATMPGILRVHFPGNKEEQFTNYKSLRATTQTTAHDVLSQALDKYRIPGDKVREYQLFEVIGTVVKLTAAIDDPLIPDEQFMELMARLMMHEERPLYVQNLSQVKDGYVRRFEIRHCPSSSRVGRSESRHKRATSASLLDINRNVHSDDEPERAPSAHSMTRSTGSDDAQNSNPVYNCPYIMTIEGAEVLSTSLSLKRELLVGQTTDSGLRLEHNTIYREHCLVGFSREDEHGPAQMWVRRASAQAKIGINSIQLPERQIWASVNNGDVLSFGKAFTGIIIDPAQRSVNISERINSVLSRRREEERMLSHGLNFERNSEISGSGRSKRTLIREISMASDASSQQDDIRPPFTPSDFEDGLADIESESPHTAHALHVGILQFDSSLVPEFTLPEANSSGERAMLKFIFKEVTPEKAGSGPFAASLLLASLKSALNQHGVDRYLKLVTSIADMIADYSTSFTKDVRDALETDHAGDRNPSSLQMAQTALPLVNRILHFSAFTSDFCQQCKCYLPKLISPQTAHTKSASEVTETTTSGIGPSASEATHRQQAHSSAVATVTSTSSLEKILRDLKSAHDDILPLFNNLLQELLISTIIRLIPVLEASIGELFSLQDNSLSANNTLSRLFVSMHRIGQAAQIHDKFQKHIMASLMSNFQLTVFETVLMNPALATRETGIMIEDKLEKLTQWFASNTGYESTVKRYTIVAQGLSTTLIEGKMTTDSVCFTETEMRALRGQSNPSAIEEIISTRRQFLERAVKKMPSLYDDAPQLDLVKTFSKAKVKRKVRHMKGFAERSYSSSEGEQVNLLAKAKLKPINTTSESGVESGQRAWKSRETIAKSTERVNKLQEDEVESELVEALQPSSANLAVGPGTEVNSVSEFMSSDTAETDGETTGADRDMSDSITEEDTVNTEFDESHFERPETSATQSQSAAATTTAAPDIAMVRLSRKAGDRQTPLGLGLVSGMHTQLQHNGVFVKTLVPGGLAAQDGNLKVGDRIAAVNGVSIVAVEYEQAITLIRNSRKELRLLVIRARADQAKRVLQPV